MAHVARILIVAALLLLSRNIDAARAADAATKPAATHAQAIAAAKAGEGDYSIGPTYTNSPEASAQPGVPRGALHEFTMSSADSKAYPGLTGPYQRRVCVYVPSQYVAGTAAPFIVVQDGVGYKGTLAPTLDNLIHAHRVPPMIAILINSGGGDGKGSERGLEYDTLSPKYAEFIENEVLPRIARDYKLKFTTDPEGRAAMGGSSGGACAFTMGWFRPDLYHRILTYSGTYVDQESPVNPESPHGAWEYHEHLIAATAPKPLRVWLEVGENDNGSKKNEASLHNWVMANERMANALQKKGYHYQLCSCQCALATSTGVSRRPNLPELPEWLWYRVYGKVTRL